LQTLAMHKLETLSGASATKRYGDDAANGAVVGSTVATLLERYKGLGITAATIGSVQKNRVRAGVVGPRRLDITIVFLKASQAQAPSAVGYARTLWQEVSGYLVRAAIDTPDSIYSYNPTPEVRSFGETLDHIIASQNGYCRLAVGEKPTGGGSGTGAKTKPDIVTALRASNDLCAKAYAQTDSDAAQPAYEGDKRSRLYQLLENAMHDNEHYGNLVTYLRLNGRIPPSSQPAPAPPKP